MIGVKSANNYLKNLTKQEYLKYRTAFSGFEYL